MFANLENISDFFFVWCFLIWKSDPLNLIWFLEGFCSSASASWDLLACAGKKYFMTCSVEWSSLLIINHLQKTDGVPPADETGGKCLHKNFAVIRKTIRNCWGEVFEGWLGYTLSQALQLGKPTCWESSLWIIKTRSICAQRSWPEYFSNTSFLHLKKLSCQACTAYRIWTHLSSPSARELEVFDCTNSGLTFWYFIFSGSCLLQAR